MAHQTYIKVTSGSVLVDGSPVAGGCGEIRRKASAGNKTRNHIITLSGHPVAFAIAALKNVANPCANWPVRAEKKIVLKVETDAAGKWRAVKFRENPKKTGSTTKGANSHYRLRKRSDRLIVVRGSLRLTVKK